MPATTDTTPGDLTIRETCAELHISRMTLSRYLGRELPVYRYGRAVRISRDDLEAFKRVRRSASANPTTDAI